ncbi:response regulator [Chamaesiphon sp. OTE_20_metabat_361]|uniref:response regulator n=1 Tax=Chamaesiphon sp. OTE_20_metabat_361 TaxID=2964689 RepID=UPI00286D421D|nr:response regulator [Chamaesiphon sp. OTE_20_metabat_361]
MYIDPELRDRVYQLFSLEVPKMLQQIETELVTLSIDRSATKVDNLLRAAHSIKGGAASLGLEAIADLAHQIEDIFRVLNHPDLPFDSNLDRLLFRIYDCLNQLVTAEINGEQLLAGFHTSTQIILADLDEEIGHFVIAGQKIPDNRLLGVDLTQSIFEVDIAQSLARLERVLLDPECDRIVVGEFRAQSEVFTGIASLTDTPGFGVLAQATIAALDRHPDRAREICCFALVDFYAALTAALTGDRDRCGAISPGFAFLIAELPTAQREGAEAVAAGVDQVEVARDLFDLADVFDAPTWSAVPTEFKSLGWEALLPSAAEVESVSTEVRSALVIEQTASLSYDLVDIFDVSIAAVIQRSTDDRANLSYDLVEIFDTPCQSRSLEPQIAVYLPTDEGDFDLVDLFEPPLPASVSRANAAVELKDLDRHIAEITSNFDKFAPLTLSTFAPPATAIKPARLNQKSRKAIGTPMPQLSVRVGLDRLERMNNVMGELAIERHGLALSNEQFGDTLGRLRSKCANFQTISDRLRQIADTLSSAAPQPPRESMSSPPSLGQEFDVLELDRYSEVQTIAQATIEQLAQIEEQIEDLSLFVTQSHRQIDRQKQLLSHLRDDLMWSRMLPLGEILNRFPRTLHDLSVEFDKPVDLKITGAGVLVDRAAIDKLFDPLVHLLRNAFDHGIDSREARQAAGKSERGAIAIDAYHQGSQTVIDITDDGRGIDINAIRTRAIARQILTPAAAVDATREQLLDLLFVPGFSTTERITKLSGRGMGLDIVKAQIQSIKGSISIDSQLGRGTTFTLRIPLTLTIAQLMICQVGNAVYAFPADSIQKIVVPTPAQMFERDRQSFCQWHDLTIPVYNLADLLTYSIPVPERTISLTLKSSAHNPADWLAPLFLIRRGDRIVALQIDRMITEQELTIAPFGTSISPPSYSYGCTILGDGEIIPVLDPHTLIRVLVEQPQPLVTTAAVPAPVSDSMPSILVIDDSITTRQSLCLSLEKFGYRTIPAKDGQEALQILRQKVSEIKLAICDVEMPNMNGFEFLNIYRQDRTISHVPVVMLTSRSNNKHRQFAAHLGAVDYFIKPYVEQDFMTAISKLIDV